MSNGPVYITSDVHLGAVPPETERAFHRWLEFAAERAEEIVINGDLFDFWFEYRSAIPRGHTRTLGLLAAIVDAGVRVLVMGGNHDAWGGEYLRTEVGVDFEADPVVRTYAGFKTLVAHGDGVGEGDQGYKALKWVLRSRLSIWGFRWLHPDVGAWLAGHVSRTEARSWPPHARTLRRSEILMRWGIDRLASDPGLDLVLLGHVHIPSLLQAHPGRWVVNSGDWTRHQSYVVLEKDASPRMFSWEDAVAMESLALPGTAVSE